MVVTLKVACVQMRSGTDISRNIAAMESFIREAAKKGANYVQTPEMTGILQRDTKALFASISTDEDDKVFAKASALARELGIWVHIGSTAIDRGDGKAANRAGLFAPTGERVASYDKIHMFDVDLANGESWRESKVYTPGDQCVVSRVDDIPLGMAICYDMRFPHLFRAQAKQGAEILTAPSSFTRQTGEAHWHVLLRARAIENGAFMIASAQGGVHEDGRETFGHSLIINPWGEIVGELNHNEPGIVVAELDLSEVAKARQRIPGLANERAFS